jgi:hypothetical protein
MIFIFFFFFLLELEQEILGERCWYTGYFCTNAHPYMGGNGMGK